jgi:hypothetical protein
MISWRTSMLKLQDLEFYHFNVHRNFLSRLSSYCKSKLDVMSCKTVPNVAKILHCASHAARAGHRSTEMGHPIYLVSDSAVRHKLQHNTGCFTFCMDVQFQIYQSLHGPYFTYLLLFHEIYKLLPPDYLALSPSATAPRASIK